MCIIYTSNMIVVDGWSAAVAVLFLVITTGWAQDPPVAPVAPVAPAAPETKPGPAKPPHGARGAAEDHKNGFIVPERMHGDVDSFTYQSTEYLAISRRRRFKTANLICRMEYNAKLAILDDKDKAMFMAEALSETNLIMDSLWISGIRVGNGTKWEWVEGNETKIIDPELVKTFSKVVDVAANDRDCLAFARLDHDVPDYRELSCNAQRAVLCERPKGGGEGNSTHPGWIKLGKRLYKIFSEQVSYAEAKKRCFRIEPDIQLAVIVNFNYSQFLGRYLLIGRPSLENAWIGAKWGNESYAFEPEPLGLANETDTSIHSLFPPWRNNKIQKVGGCLLLDRHLANITLFVEARCERQRGYICYKLATNATGNESFSDVIIGDNGYRIHYRHRSWHAAYQFCKVTYEPYGAYLAEIPTVDVKYELLYVMGENRTAVQHIWLGATFASNDTKGWTWQKDKSVVNVDILDWVKNTTYNDEVEDSNVCLDMDRENHIKGLHYGAQCDAPQMFVCSFTKAKLLELQEYERKQEEARLGD